MSRVAWLFGLVALLGGATSARAHRASDGTLRLSVSDENIRGQLELAVRDIAVPLELDSNRDGQVTWSEVEREGGRLGDYVTSKLAFANGADLCVTAAQVAGIVDRSEGTYLVWNMSAHCPTEVASLSVRYDVLFDFDRQHRGLLDLASPSSARTAIFSPEIPVQTFQVDQPAPFGTLVGFVREGVHHIFAGIDHILFLFALLLPAVLIRRRQELVSRAWQPAKTFKGALGEVLKIVTAFTVAHSITLGLATLGVLTVPSRVTETAIAVSVLLAAVNNVYPVVETRWSVAFALGLLHGFGFSSVLAEAGLPEGSKLLALVGFNLGVELGQLAIVTVFLPLAFLVRSSWAYRRVALVGGSLAIAALAVVWSVERWAG